MNKELDAKWKRFLATGSVNDYLAYRAEVSRSRQGERREEDVNDERWFGDSGDESRRI